MKVEQLESVAGVPLTGSSREVRRSVIRAQLLRLAMRGCRAIDASKQSGVPLPYVQKIYRDPDFQREVLNKVNGAFENSDASFIGQKETMLEKMERAASDSFDVLFGMLSDQETMPSLRVKIAQDFMDRNEGTQAGHTVRTLHIDSDRLVQAATAAQHMDTKLSLVPKKESA